MVYYVRLEILIGEYEKQTDHLIAAETPRKAGDSAILSEAHNPPVADKDYPSLFWDDDMAYRVHDVRPVPKEDVGVLIKYMNLWEA